MNVRLHKLATKKINKLREILIKVSSDIYKPHYKLLDFIIDSTPIRKRKMSIPRRILKYHYNNRTNKKGKLFKGLLKIALKDRKEPEPLY